MTDRERGTKRRILTDGKIETNTKDGTFNNLKREDAIMSSKVFEIVTKKILDQLDRGVVPWSQPWRTLETPRNLITGKDYRGVNLWLLPRNYQSRYFLTLRQANSLGAKIKKGEKSHLVVFWKMLKVKDDKDNRDNKDDKKEKIIPLLRYYRVFNVEQCTDIKHKRLTEEKKQQATNKKKINTIEDAEQIIRNYADKPAIMYGGNHAYYYPHSDIINLPKKSQFDNLKYFYATAYHEMGHSTGHEKRLNRQIKNHFGSHLYSKEELIAEMTSAMLCGIAGIDETIQHNASYIENWKNKLREDEKCVVYAAAGAEKAAQYILTGEKPEY